MSLEDALARADVSIQNLVIAQERCEQAQRWQDGVVALLDLRALGSVRIERFGDEWLVVIADFAYAIGPDPIAAVLQARTEPIWSES